MPLSEEELAAKEEELAEKERKQQEKEAEMEKTLAGISDKVKGQEDLVKLLSDPSIREVLAAQEAGLVVRVKTEKPDESPDLDDTTDLEQLDNRGLLAYMAKNVFPNALKAALKPVMEALAGVKGYVDSQEDAGVLKQVEEARKKFSDFNDYREDILKISRVSPGLSVEELYYIARRRKGGDLKVNPATEKPTSTGGRPAQGKKPSMKPGKAGFESTLARVLNESPAEE